MKGVLVIHRQAGYFGAQLVARYDASFCAIAVQAQTTQLSGREVYGVPFEHYTGLRSVPAS